MTRPYGAQQRRKVPTTAFRSQSARFQREPQGTRAPADVYIVGNEQAPPVGSYEIKSSFSKARSNNTKASSLGSRGTSSAGKVFGQPGSGFGSSNSRFSGKSYMGQVAPATPGPGQYIANMISQKPQIRRPLAPKGVCSQDARFKSGQGSYRNTNATSSDLGPGAYDTAGSMIKRSFNITMAQS